MQREHEPPTRHTTTREDIIGQKQDKDPRDPPLHIPQIPQKWAKANKLRKSPAHTPRRP